MSKEAMKLALKALDHNLLFTSLMPGYDGRVIEKAYKEINKVLAEPVKHELQCICGCSWEIDADGNEELVSSPPAQQEPLTDEKIIASNYPDGEENGPTIAAPDFELICFARQIEAAHGIKENT